MSNVSSLLPPPLLPKLLLLPEIFPRKISRGDTTTLCPFDDEEEDDEEDEREKQLPKLCSMTFLQPLPLL